MAIKTNELQQLASILGTDSLLADTAAAGTGRLTMAQAAAFFGAELIKEGNPVAAALSSKAALSAQETLEQTTVPSKSVTVPAADLPGYIAALPRLLTEHLYIQASGSLTANAINFEGFYGSGSIQIVQTDPDAVFKTQAILNYCNIHVIFNGICFCPPDAGAIKNTYYGVRAVYCKSVEVHNCSFTGGSSIKNDYCAVNCNVGTNMHAYNIRADHCGTVALISNGAMLSLCAGDDANALHDNTTGAYVYCGGALFLFGNTPDLLGGVANASGGLIVRPDGTLLTT